VLREIIDALDGTVQGVVERGRHGSLDDRDPQWITAQLRWLRPLADIYMKDLTKWTPVGSTTHGKGAKFAVATKAGPMTLSSVVDITTWTENTAIGWTSREGFKQTGKWSFITSGDGTDSTFDMDYELPGGVAGRMLSRVAEPIVRGNIQQSVRNLRSHVEKAARNPASAAAARPAKQAPKAARGPAVETPRVASKRTSKAPSGKR
jgi:carbon monoxide dehydrogenase subunit G